MEFASSPTTDKLFTIINANIEIITLFMLQIFPQDCNTTSLLFTTRLSTVIYEQIKTDLDKKLHFINTYNLHYPEIYYHYCFTVFAFGVLPLITWLSNLIWIIDRLMELQSYQTIEPTVFNVLPEPPANRSPLD